MPLPPLPTDLPLTTRRGTAISNTVRCDMAPGVLRNDMDYNLKSWNFSLGPNLAEVHHPDATYDCAGLVFASRRAHVGVSEVENILNMDEYASVDPRDVQVGDVVTWESKAAYDHVGIVAQTRKLHPSGTRVPVVLSKWGGGGAEFLHAPMLVPPLYGLTVRYWRVDRRPTDA